MSSRIAILGAKGGVGKTTVALNLGCLLAQAGRQVTLVDGDLHTPHISINLGYMHPPVSLHDVLQAKATLKQSLYVHASGLRIIPGSIAYDSISKVSYAQFTQVCEELRDMGEVVIIDGPSGFGEQCDAVVKGADSVIVVAAPDLASQSDALKSVLRARELGKPVLGMIVNHVSSAVDMKSIASFVGVPIIGVVPQDGNVFDALGAFYPVVMAYPTSPASRAFDALAKSVVGGWIG